MKTLAIINQKGGVGKTTTAVNLAHGLTKYAGMRVLLVDLDSQGNVADALGLPKWGHLYNLLVDMEVVITASGRQGLDVILSDKTTVEAKQVLAGRNFREAILRSGLAMAQTVSGNAYDVCILDAAPGADLLQVGALIAADAFLVPVALDHLAVVGAGDVLATAVSLNEISRHGARFLGVLPTMWERTTSESDAQMRFLVEQYNSWVWQPIPRDTKAREASAHGQTLWEYAPTCRALVGVEIDGQPVGGYVAALARLVVWLGEGK